MNAMQWWHGTIDRFNLIILILIYFYFILFKNTSQGRNNKSQGHEAYRW
jgi:hypothetical protein